MRLVGRRALVSGGAFGLHGCGFVGMRHWGHHRGDGGKEVIRKIGGFWVQSFEWGKGNL